MLRKKRQIVFSVSEEKKFVDRRRKTADFDVMKFVEKLIAAMIIIINRSVDIATIVWCEVDKRIQHWMLLPTWWNQFVLCKKNEFSNYQILTTKYQSQVDFRQNDLLSTLFNIRS